jgi:hypothetical protein
VDLVDDELQRLLVAEVHRSVREVLRDFAVDDADAVGSVVSHQFSPSWCRHETRQRWHS